MQKTSLKIDNKHINIEDYLKTINQYSNTMDVKIEDYNELGGLLHSIINVCKTALLTFHENQDYTERQKQDVLGCTSYDVANVLGLAKQMLPMAELELLSEMSIEKN